MAPVFPPCAALASCNTRALSCQQMLCSEVHGASLTGIMMIPEEQALLILLLVPQPGLLLERRHLR